MNQPPPIPPPLPQRDGVVTWHGSVVSVRSRVVPRYLWTTVSIDVYLDGQRILETGGKLNPTGSCAATFNQGGFAHNVELSWGVGMFYSFPYQVKIDGVPLMASRVRADNWYLTLMVGLVFGTILGVVMFWFGHVMLHGILK